MSPSSANTAKIARLPSGGTACGCTVNYLNQHNLKADLVIVISDNESWADMSYNKTGLMAGWDTFKKSNPNAKLVCLDLTPKTSAQVTPRSDVLYIGGFSDAVFTTVKNFVSGNKNAWIKNIENFLTF
jgi:60 kDa SS-A/Ro ribonucleoprotein